MHHAQNPFVTIWRKRVLWSSVKNQFALFTKWATLSWSNWDKHRRQFSVFLAWKRTRGIEHVAMWRLASTQSRYDGQTQSNICSVGNSVLSYSSSINSENPALHLPLSTFQALHCKGSKERAMNWTSTEKGHNPEPVASLEHSSCWRRTVRKFQFGSSYESRFHTRAKRVFTSLFVVSDSCCGFECSQRLSEVFYGQADISPVWEFVLQQSRDLTFRTHRTHLSGNHQKCHAFSVVRFVEPFNGSSTLPGIDSLGCCTGGSVGLLTLFPTRTLRISCHAQLWGIRSLTSSTCHRKVHISSGWASPSQSQKRWTRLPAVPSGFSEKTKSWSSSMWKLGVGL